MKFKKSILTGALFVALLFSSNLYGQWQSLNSSFQKDANCIVKTGTKIFVGLNDSGVYVLTNSAGIWTPTYSGLSGSTIISITANGTNIFAGTYRGGIFKSLDNGGSWSSANTGIPARYIWTMASNGGTLYAGTERGVYISTNNGTNWTEKSTGLPVGFVNVETFCFSGTNIFIGTNGNGVYLSTNNGTSWSSKNSGMGSNKIYGLTLNGSNLYAANHVGVSQSTNNGSNWTEKNNGLSTSGIYSISSSGSNIFAGTLGGGIYLSNNNGDNWSTSNTGLPSIGKIINEIVISGTDVIIGTMAGIYIRPISDFVGIKENKMDATISLYPNPVNNELNVEMLETGINFKMNIEIFDLMGQSIYKTDFSGKQKIDVTSLLQGIYLIKIYKNEGSFLVKHFIKQ